MRAKGAVVSFALFMFDATFRAVGDISTFIANETRCNEWAARWATNKIVKLC